MKKHGPWKIKSSTIKYKNKWISVHEDQVVRPDGNPGIFGIVEMVPGVSILPMDEEGNIYLTKEFKYAIGKNSVEVFSGAIDEGESILKAAKRELQEELGCIAKNWVKLGKMDPFTSVVFSPANLFLAKGLSFTNTAFEGTEIITHIKLPLAKAVQMVMDSKITHGQSCVLILKAWNYLNGSGRA
ncbi:MAG: NUDIX hydrolase [Candidatus Magasanikbacteria bacterium]|nr:NUDIX hydrolase [Candidatus Magasanikbacteria bacterium]